ncbi:GTP-binding protein [Bacillus kwashiorkori]|uniref:GTP-binding protein n=1 Tax=Bacillus kwashiorkori TaxID=1522318 RepID=UPI0007809C35|nr:TetM/TetW/TetO/TetS family tetracycline resistance ribosomal protection protein [Bacillus kwashiorkori]
MNKTIGILAHVDAGKTTFSEQLLYHTKSIKQRGRVDHQNAFLDSHNIEKQRGITVFADQAVFHYLNSTYYLIDTPGHVDFSPEMERAIQVMDYAIIIISAVEGIEGHTETVYRLLRKHRIPVFFFINKIDRSGANVDSVIHDIKENLTSDVMDVTNSFHFGHFSNDLVEWLAERDEELLDAYINNIISEEFLLSKTQWMIQNGVIFPLFSGSALQDIGIKSFLDNFHFLTKTNDDSNHDEPFAGRVYKIRHEESGTRLSFIKAIKGKLAVRDELTYLNENGIEKHEKITQIRVYNGNQFQTVNEVFAGQLFAVTGLTDASIGCGLGTLKEKEQFELIPTLKSKVVFAPSVNPKEVLKYFKVLEAEDPSLSVKWDEYQQEIHLHVMGKIQLEVLEQIIPERFHLNVQFAKPEILYKETIEKEVVGYGHFEPLRHYAEVHLKIEPGERNSGISFVSECHTDDLSYGLQNLIKQHIYEREHHGLLTGSALTDVKITLLTGRDHNKHTHGGDFREATFRAIRQGLEKANNILLEPYYKFKITVSIEQMGRVLSDIQAAHGQFDTPLTAGDKALITGMAPVATFMEYSAKLAALTQGKGSIWMELAGYFRCHNEQEIIAKINYNKNADPDYTSSSVFCAKGQSFSVKWDEAEKMMHCLK